MYICDLFPYNVFGPSTNVMNTIHYRSVSKHFTVSKYKRTWRSLPIQFHQYQRLEWCDFIWRGTCFFFFFLVSWGGVRLSPFRTSATKWPTLPAPDDRWVWSSWWNDSCQAKPKYSEKTRPSATLPLTNSTWPDLGSYPCRRGGKPATNRLSYGKASDGELTNSMDLRPSSEATSCSATEEFPNIL
jgi:hypothetical protein